MKFHSLTNTNPLLQEKMRFFADYFSFSNDFLGKLPELPFENGHSIVSKILFQLKNNRKHCIVYIENYITQLFQFYQYDSVTKTTAFNAIEKYLEDMKNYSAQNDKTPKLTWINHHPEFIEALELLQKEYEIDFEGNLEVAYKLITCNCSLLIHINQLKYCAHSLVSEFRLKGHSEESVSKYIDRLLKRDFPLPPEILGLNEESEKASKTKEFLQNKVFKEQLYGLRNILQANIYQSGFFIFLVKDAYLDEELKAKFMVTLDKVTFVSANHKHLENLKNNFIKRYSKNDYNLAPNFFDSNYILAYLKLNYEKVEITQQIGLDLVKQELKQLNQYLHTNLTVDNQDFIFSKDISLNVDSIRYGLGSNHNSRVQALFIQDAEENVFEQLRCIESQAKDKILQSETTFLKAFSSDEISSYWVYIENLFWNTEYEGIENIRKVVTKIFLKKFEREKGHIVSRIASALGNIYHFGNTEESIGLSDKEVKFIVDEVFSRQNQDVDIYKYRRKISNPFLKDILPYIKNFYSTSQREKWKKFYSSILLELYEYRNIELHNGITLDSSKKKLLVSIPSLVNRLRWFFVDSARLNPHQDLDELIEAAIKKNL